MQKRINRSRCRLGQKLAWSQETTCETEPQIGVSWRIRWNNFLLWQQCGLQQLVHFCHVNLNSKTSTGLLHVKLVPMRDFPLKCRPIHITYRFSGSTRTAAWLSQLPGTLFRILSGLLRAAQTVLGVYLKRTCSRDTSASSALWVLNDTALCISTHSHMHSLT